MNTFSQEAARMERSIMREMIQLTAQPHIIALSGGLPASEFLPTAAIQECTAAVLARENGDALQYRPPYPPLREWIVGYMRSRGVDCTADQVFITNGNQQGLSLLSRLFLDPGDPAVTEKITFTGIHQVTSGRGMTMHHLPTDLCTGVDVAALESALASEPRPRLVFLVPDFHNPLGVSMTAEKRQRVAELAAAYQVPLVEDDPYSALRFAGEPLPAIKAYDADGMVFYMGSFSKMLIPAARLGWIIAPADLLPRLTVLRESFDLESSALMQRIVGEFLVQGRLDDHLKRLNSAHRERSAALMDALQRHLGDIATWTEPQGGLFLWVTVPSVDTWALFRPALDAGVAYIPGRAFGGDDHTMRLNFSKVTPEQIEKGVRRLAGVVRA